MTERRLPLVLLAGALLGLGLGAQILTGRAWTLFRDDPTAFSVPPLEPPARGAALTQRVVLLLIDGLSHSPSTELPGLNALRSRGADYICEVGQPSLSNPGRAVLFTGAWQEIHGQLTNFNVRPLRIDTLFKELQRVGLRSGVAGPPVTLTLIGTNPDRIVTESGGEFGPDLSLMAEGERQEEKSILALVGDKSLSLAFAELNATDDAGHFRGAASPEYRLMAQGADRVIEAVAERLDFTRDTLVVTADHGHTARGGHGGPERAVLEVPLVLAGAGIRLGVKGSVRQIDVAPTIAALLGIPVPSSNQGRVLAGALGPVDGLLRASCVQRQDFVRRYASRLGIPIGTVPPCGASSDAQTLGALDVLEHDLKRSWQRSEIFYRGLRALGVGTALFLVFLLVQRTGILKDPVLDRAAPAGAVGGLLYFALLPVFSLSYSLSAVNKDSELPAYLGKDIFLGVGLCVAATLFASLPLNSLKGRVEASLLTEAAFLLPLLLKIAIVYVFSGVFVGTEVPNPYWGFGFYLDALVVMAVGYATPLLLIGCVLLGSARDVFRERA